MTEIIEAKKSVDILNENKEGIFKSWEYLFDNFFKNNDYNMIFNEQWFNILFKSIIHAVRDEIDYSLLDFSVDDMWAYDFVTAEQIPIEKFIDFITACLAIIEPYLEIDDNRKIWHLKNYVSYSVMLSSYDGVLSSLRYKKYALEDLGAIIVFLDNDMNVLWKNEKVNDVFPNIKMKEKCEVDFLNQDIDYYGDKRYSIHGNNGECIKYTVRSINGYFLICGQNIDVFGINEEELYSVKSKLQFVLDSYPTPMMILSQDGTILRYGKSFQCLMKKYGIFKNKFLNKKFKDIDLFANNEALFVAMKDYLDNKNNFEATLKCTNGCEFSLIANSIYDLNHKEIIGYIVVLHDVGNNLYLKKRCNDYEEICKVTLNMLEGFAVVIDNDFNILFSNDLAEQLLKGNDNLRDMNDSLAEYIFKVMKKNNFVKNSKQEVVEFDKTKEIQISIKKIDGENILIQLRGIHFAIAELKENLLEAQKNWDILEDELKNKHIGGKKDGRG
jgi:hypothetical protein